MCWGFWGGGGGGVCMVELWTVYMCINCVHGSGSRELQTDIIADDAEQ